MRRVFGYWPVLVLFMVGIWSIYGLWVVPGLPTSHDSIAHMTRIYAYKEGLLEGIFPVLWSRQMFWGIGSPVLMLNYQIPYYFVMLWHWVGFNLTDSFKLVLSFSQIASGLFMYFTLRIRYKTLPSLVGGILYMIAPYRLLNIFVRGAMGEVFAVMFPPLILAGIWKKSVQLQTIGWAGLFLSHPVGSALYSGVFLGYTLWRNGFKKIIFSIKQFFIPYFLAFVMAAFNLLPTLALTKHTYYNPTNSNTLQQFPTFRQLIYSKWGYGSSTTDTKDEMSFQIGVIQWLLAIVAMVLIVRRKKVDENNWEIAFYLAIFVGAILLMLEKVATPFYVYLGLGRIIDFPWRILMIFSFLTAMLGSQIINAVKRKTTQWLLFLFLVLGALYTNRNHIRINAVWPWPNDSFRHGTGDAFGEYASRWRATREGSEFYELAEFIQGEGEIKVVLDLSSKILVKVATKEPAIVRFNMMYFPGWMATINNKIIPIDITQSPKSNESPCFVTTRTTKNIDDSGLMACQAEAGTSSMMLQYQALPIQRIGNLITLVGIGIYLWILCRSYYQRITSGKRS